LKSINLNSNPHLVCRLHSDEKVPAFL
jgi:hypothetical protein